jgi:hypothetical protein
MNTSSQKLKSLYQINDVIPVKVIEQVDDRAWIVSLQGVLIQVYNSTSQPLKEGEVLPMRLISLDPPKLSWN